MKEFAAGTRVRTPPAKPEAAAGERAASLVSATALRGVWPRVPRRPEDCPTPDEGFVPTMSALNGPHLCARKAPHGKDDTELLCRGVLDAFCWPLPGSHPSLSGIGAS